MHHVTKAELLIQIGTLLLLLDAGVGILAYMRGRSFARWAIASFLVSPLIAIVLFVLPDLRSARRRAAQETAERPSAPSLPVRTIKAAGFRMGQTRPISTLSNAKSSARRSLEEFSTRAELDREISRTVGDQFHERGG